MTKRSLAAATGGVAAVAAAAVALGPATDPDGTATEPAPRVLDVVVQPITFEPGHAIELRHTGTIRARRDVTLGVEVGGLVVAVLADVGHAVRAGDPLLRIDTTLAAASRSELRARREATAAALAEAEAGPRREVIDAARAAARRATEDLRLAELQVQRTRDLVQREVASQDELDVATTRVATLAAALAEAEARLAELENGTRVEVLAAARARVLELDAAIARLDVEIADATLAAPFDGVIAARHVDEGAVLAVGAPALRLVETGHLEAWFGLPGEVAAEVARCADRCAITVDGRAIVATGARLLPAVDAATRTTTVVFDLDPATAPLPRAGDVARLGLTRTVDTRGAWLPVEALSAGTRGLWSCYVVTGGADAARIARADVEVLHVAGDRAFVRGTLADGDRVVARGVQRIVPGQRVRPIDLAVSPAGEGER